ncbi:MAG: DUF4040 domain-containing protein [Eubacteriales bacterium]|nr:DUF4040 domain-containing protein [Eubacteriales bacterium]
MISELEIMLMICLIVLAFITVQTQKLRRSAVYLGAFSLLCSFAYLSYNAPDVAIAEAVIGCTLSTILLLIAMKKYHVITIFYVQDEAGDPAAIKKERRELTTSLERFLLDRGFEPQTISTDLDDRELCENECFNLLIMHEKNDITIYSSGIRYIAPDVQEYIVGHKPPHLNVSFYCVNERAPGGETYDE